MKIISKISFSLLICSSIVLSFAVTAASAQSVFDKAKENLGKIGESAGYIESAADINDISDEDTYRMFANVVNVVLGVVGMVAMIYIIYSGFKWITAAGNSQDVQAAKEGIRDAVIGLFVIMLSFVIVNFVVTELINVFKD